MRANLGGVSPFGPEHMTHSPLELLSFYLPRTARAHANLTSLCLLNVQIFFFALLTRLIILLYACLLVPYFTPKHNPGKSWNQNIEALHASLSVQQQHKSKKQIPFLNNCIHYYFKTHNIIWVMNHILLCLKSLQR